MRVLLVTSRFPLPPRRGNQVRTVEWLAALAGGDGVGVVAPAPASAAQAAALDRLGAALYPYELPAAGRALGVARAVLTGLPLQEGLYRLPSALRAVERALGEPWDVAVVQLVRCGWAAPALVARGLPVLFDAIDSMALHFGRTAARSGPLARAVFTREARRCRRREGHLSALARVTAAVARRDLEALQPPPGRSRLVPVSAAARPAAAAPATPCLVLTGNLGYRPTVRGAVAFARGPWPELRRRHPRLRLVLAGARPAPAVRRLARLEGVEVYPDPPDLAPYLAQASLALAPMAEGSGVPLKVLEAWSAGLPVVAHPWAAAGLEAAPGEHLLTASSAAEWCRAIGAVLADASLARRLGEAGRQRWAEVYRPEAVAEAVRAAVAAAG